MCIRARDLAYECCRVGHAKAVSAERTQTHDAEIRVAEHYRVRRTPFHIRELLRIHEVNFGLERRIKAVLPGTELGQDRCVAAVYLVFAGGKDVSDLAFVNENRGLRLSNDQLSAVLYLLPRHREPVHERIARVIEPLDDLNELI